MDYKVYFTYSEPRMGDVVLTNVNDDEQARAIAIREIEIIYPEAVDIQVIKTEEI